MENNNYSKLEELRKSLSWAGKQKIDFKTVVTVVVITAVSVAAIGSLLYVFWPAIEPIANFGVSILQAIGFGG